MSDPMFLKVDEVGQKLRIHPSTLGRQIEARELPALRVGREWRIPAAWLEVDSRAGLVGLLRKLLDRTLPGPDMLLPGEVRRVLRCTPTQLRDLSIPSVGTGRATRYRREEVIGWILAQLR